MTVGKAEYSSCYRCGSDYIFTFSTGKTLVSTACACTGQILKTMAVEIADLKRSVALLTAQARHDTEV